MDPQSGAGNPIPSEVVLFGYPASPARAYVLVRSRVWRAGGALRTAALFLLAAPVAALIPPHAPWAIGALVTGTVLGMRRWSEGVTLLGVDALCPRCGTRLTPRPGRLREPHPLPCEACHHVSSLRLVDRVRPDAGSRAPTSFRSGGSGP